jgi:hypothetical protein
MADKSVPLSRQYEAHGVVFKSVTVREPRWEDILLLGEPFEAQRTPEGGQLVVENTEAVAAYVKRCVIEPTPDKLVELGVADTRAVRDAVIGFFHPGAAPGTGSTTQSGKGPTT